MPETRSKPTSSTEQTTIHVSCPSCARLTRHQVVKATEYSTEWRDGDFTVDSWDKFQIIECMGCGSVGFRHAHENSEDLEPDDEAEGFVPVTLVKLYPSRVAGRRALENVHMLPWDIRRMYDETREALGSGLQVLAGIGLRALIEAVCNERSAQGNNLEKRIDSLVTQGILTAPGAEILHSLRLMGNKSAHEVKPHSIEDLTVALDVVEYVLNGVYLLPALAGNLPRRNVQNGPPAISGP